MRLIARGSIVEASSLLIQEGYGAELGARGSFEFGAAGLQREII
jgi:hypothetical protein